ncbi:hypothetical protein LEP1GSC185_3036 [Leptospira licerasiae serovar Varillal str. VAR 010]|uniref:Uncharacterized protein n=1 Tax=Leptospira licerasiae str. MMD4847 TaxID=1049971 RepID=A0ABN0HA21_9LEPT|nr:hypothetical protein LEP1GSC185_3036 [Leptospira licerasiae serovar Varillal str. VAR 010]EJZ42535.1 hypothetical protein LEP1GSC178_2654 [Leptospira licerasiae str. MMD4847]
MEIPFGDQSKTVIYSGKRKIAEGKPLFSLAFRKLSET